MLARSITRVKRDKCPSSNGAPTVEWGRNFVGLMLEIQNIIAHFDSFIIYYLLVYDFLYFPKWLMQGNEYHFVGKEIKFDDSWINLDFSEIKACLRVLLIFFEDFRLYYIVYYYIVYYSVAKSYLPGMTSPLNVISTKCVTASCGTNDARKRWLPSALTKLVTCPPFTRISKFPEPALDPSTDKTSFIIECT